MTAHGATSDPLGTAEEEARRLFDALRALTDGEHAAGAECRVCPLCRLLAALRRTRPEVVDHLADAATSLAAALRAVVAEPDSPVPDSPVPDSPVPANPMPDSGSYDHPTAPEASRPGQRIDVTD